MSISARRLQRVKTSAPAQATLSLWPTNPTPATVSDADTAAIELGVKFSSTIATTVLGVRFYKGPFNTGTHSGSLWNTGGTRLRTVTFTGETASGWQQMMFAAPYAIAANTTYIVSYFAPNGRYSSNPGYFSSAYTSGFLSSPASSTSINGLYRYFATSTFPTQSSGSANYWVDVIVSGVSDSTPPTAPSGLTSTVNGSIVSLTWNASTDAVGVAGYRIHRGGSQIGTSATTTYTDTTASPSTSYTYTVYAYDYSDNLSSVSNSRAVTTGANSVPIASFTTSPSGRSVLVNASASSDSDGTIASYAWNFGDSDTATGSTASHTYAADGTYTITLVVTDNSGATGSTTRSVTVTAGGFVANLINNPSLGGYPDASNTGVPEGTNLTNSGYITVNTNGAIIQNLNITGNIIVNANNVTIRNCRINSSDAYPIENMGSNLLIEDCEIIGSGSGVACGVAFENYTIRRCNISGGADGLKANADCVIEDCYIHDLYVTADSHNDGIQTTGGNNVDVIHNTIDLGGAGVAIQFGSTNNGWLVQNNLFRCTGWVLNGSSGTINTTVTNNRFAPVAGWYGAGSIPGSGLVWTGNYLDTNGNSV